jgi:hypothetical protein
MSIAEVENMPFIEFIICEMYPAFFTTLSWRKLMPEIEFLQIPESKKYT